MERVLTWATWQAVQLATWMAECIPVRLRAARTEWTVTAGNDPDTEVWVVFVPSTMAKNPFHVCYLWSQTGVGGAMCIDAATRGWLHALPASTRLEAFARRIGRYRVKVRLSRQWLMEHGEAPVGAMDCTTLGKRLLGLDNWRIITPVQLLNTLWEMRDE